MGSPLPTSGGGEPKTGGGGGGNENGKKKLKNVGHSRGEVFLTGQAQFFRPQAGPNWLVGLGGLFPRIKMKTWEKKKKKKKKKQFFQNCFFTDKKKKKRAAAPSFKKKNQKVA